MSQPPLHPSEKNRHKAWSFWVWISALLLAVAGVVVGLVLWSQSLIFSYEITEYERKLLLNATQMIESLAVENDQLVVGVGPEDYYKQRLPDGTGVIGYSYNHDEPELKFTLMHEIRAFVDEEKAIADYSEAADNAARSIGPNTEDDSQADVFHAWKAAANDQPASAVLVQRSGNKVMIMQLSGDFSDDENLLLFLAEPFRKKFAGAKE